MRLRQAALVTFLPMISCRDIDKIRYSQGPNWDSVSRRVLAHWLYRKIRDCRPLRTWPPTVYHKHKKPHDLSLMIESLAGGGWSPIAGPTLMSLTDIGIVWHRLHIALDLGFHVLSWPGVRLGLRVGVTSIAHGRFQMTHSLGFAFLWPPSFGAGWLGWNVRVLNLSWRIKKNLWIHAVPLELLEYNFVLLVGLSWNWDL